MATEKEKLKQTVKALQTKIAKQYQEIKHAQDELLIGMKLLLQLSDEEQWYIEAEQTVFGFKNRRKFSEKKMIGRVYWKESFKDEDTGKVITLERNQIVKIDGVWQDDAIILHFLN